LVLELGQQFIEVQVWPDGGGPLLDPHDSQCARQPGLLSSGPKTPRETTEAPTQGTPRGDTLKRPDIPTHGGECHDYICH
jgi:hypothetical protein